MERVLTFVSPTCNHLHVCVCLLWCHLFGRWRSSGSRSEWVCFLNQGRQVHTLSETPGMESAGPKERHTLRVLRRHKTTELNYNHRVTTASSAQYTQTTERRQCGGEAQKKERSRDRNREKDNPVCRKVHIQRVQIRGTTNYTQLGYDLNFKEIKGHYLWSVLSRVCCIL